MPSLEMQTRSQPWKNREATGNPNVSNISVYECNITTILEWEGTKTENSASKEAGNPYEGKLKSN